MLSYLVKMISDLYNTSTIKRTRETVKLGDLIVPKCFIINGVDYCLEKIAGYGSAGIVYKYTSMTGKSIAVKAFESDDSYMEECCYVGMTDDYIISAVALDGYIIMDYKMGNLEQFLKIHKYDPNFKNLLRGIIISICDIAQKCYENGTIHYDLKLGNFLYDIESSGNMKVVLADLGGFVSPKSNILDKATYPPLSHSDNIEKNIVWMLSILILIGVHYNKGDVKEIYGIFSHDKITHIEVVRYINRMKNKKLANLIKINEDDRMSLNELCEYVRSDAFMDCLE